MKVLIFILLFTHLYCAAETIYISSGPSDNVYVQKALPIVESMYKNLGYDVVFNFTSFERSLRASISGQFDGELFRAKSIADVSETLIIVDEPLFYVNYIAYTVNPEVIIQKWDDLYKYKIALVRGVKAVLEKTKDMDFLLANTHNNAFTLLTRGHVDIVIAGNVTAEKIIENERYQKVDFNEYILYHENAYHFVNEKRSDLISPLKQSLSDIKSNQ